MARSAAKRKFRASRHKFEGTTPGRLNVRALSADEMASEQPHRRELPDGLKLAPEAETPFGRMFLSGYFNDPHDPTKGWSRHQAGLRYGTIALAYLSSIGSPRDSLPGGRGYPCNGDLRCGQEESGPPCECRRRKEAYEEAFECMSGDHKAQVEVSHVAVHSKPCRSIDNLLRGLDLLVLQLLTNRRNRGYR